MSNGLYCHDTDLSNYRTHKLSNHVSSYNFFNTVASKLKLYTCWEIKNADKTKQLYRDTPFPSPQRLIDLLDLDYFQNFPITSSDARRATYIYGVDMAYLQDKIMRDHPSRVAGIPNMHIP